MGFVNTDVEAMTLVQVAGFNKGSTLRVEEWLDSMQRNGETSGYGKVYQPSGYYPRGNELGRRGLRGAGFG